MAWPPNEREWDEILGDLPVDGRLSARGAIDAAAREYLGGAVDAESSSERSQQWKRVQSLAKSTGILAFREAILKVCSHDPMDPEAAWLAGLADQLEAVAEKARARALFYRPRTTKARLYTGLIRAWTNAGGFIGASEEGPLQRFLCQITMRVGICLSDRGAKDVIRREQKRRAALEVLHEPPLGAVGGMAVTTSVIDPTGRKKTD